MDIIELARISQQLDREANNHNQAPETIEAVNNRNCFINNTAGYNTGNAVHEAQSLQIASREDWNNVGAIFPVDDRAREFFETPYPFIEELLRHFDLGHGNAYGDLHVSLLRELNQANGIYRAILMIYVTPHRDFVDGDFLFTEYSHGDATYLAIQEMFDENPYNYTEQLTEYDILNLAADQLDAEHLMNEYFYDGFVSMRFLDDEHNQAQPFENHYVNQLPPPPPPDHDLDLAYIYFEQIANYPDEEFDENIIPYWLENEERRQQLREIQAGRDRIQAQG
jgi:hypothetical protein